MGALARHCEWRLQLQLLQEVGGPTRPAMNALLNGAKAEWQQSLKVLRSDFTFLFGRFFCFFVKSFDGKITPLPIHFGSVWGKTW